MNKTKELAYWINNRELMRERKFNDRAGLHQWKHGYHDDPHMGAVRYCNVRREDDKVTRWLAENWRPRHHQVWHILLARLINRVETLQRLLPLLEYHDVGLMRDELKALRCFGPIFGSAYTVSTNGRSMDKVDYVLTHIVQPAMAFQLPNKEKTLASAASRLCLLNGVSSFMAGQIVADLKNTREHALYHASDWHTWACPGPGSLKGLSAYFQRQITPAQFLPALRECYEETMPHLEPYVPPLHMQDFQNCMCEFSKYERVRHGGHARNKYVRSNQRAT
jgi:hypothetical protein